MERFEPAQAPTHVGKSKDNERVCFVNVCSVSARVLRLAYPVCQASHLQHSHRVKLGE